MSINTPLYGLDGWCRRACFQVSRSKPRCLSNRMRKMLAACPPAGSIGCLTRFGICCEALAGRQDETQETFTIPRQFRCWLRADKNRRSYAPAFKEEKDTIDCNSIPVHQPIELRYLASPCLALLRSQCLEILRRFGGRRYFLANICLHREISQAPALFDCDSEVRFRPWYVRTKEARLSSAFLPAGVT